PTASGEVGATADSGLTFVPSENRQDHMIASFRAQSGPNGGQDRVAFAREPIEPGNTLDTLVSRAVMNLSCAMPGIVMRAQEERLLNGRRAILSHMTWQAAANEAVEQTLVYIEPARGELRAHALVLTFVGKRGDSRAWVEEVLRTVRFPRRGAAPPTHPA